MITSSDDGTVKLWDVKTGEFIRNLVALESGGSGGVVWRIRYVLIRILEKKIFTSSLSKSKNIGLFSVRIS